MTIMFQDDSRLIDIGKRRLIHHPLCPFSRFIRMVMTEKEIDFTLIEEPFWQKRENFLYLNPAGTVPVLAEVHKKTLICDVTPIFEYLEESFPETSLMPGGVAERAEIRRLCHWFHVKFYNEVSGAILKERVWSRLSREGYPESGNIRLALREIVTHMLYLSQMLERRDWIAGTRNLSAADLAAAAHLSVADFLGVAPWTHQSHPRAFEIVRDWYARIKSRRSFRELTGDTVEGFMPPAYYADPDF
jgi:glutathione S-transferase